MEVLMRLMLRNLLIVEDEPITARGLLRTFREPLPELKEKYGAPRCRVDLATTSTQAIELLHNAKSRYRPYDVLLLDLELPDLEGNKPRLNEGLSILHDHADGNACTMVIVFSKYADLEAYPAEANSIRESSPHVLDFIPKPFTRYNEDVYRSTLQAFRHAPDRQAHEWLACRHRRDCEWYAPHRQTQIADEYSRVFSTSIDEVLYQTRKLESCLQVQYYLHCDRDHDDPMCQAVAGVQDAAYASLNKWTENRQRSDLPSPDTLQTVEVGHLVDAVLDELRAGFAYRRMDVEKPVFGELRLRTFPQYVKNIFKEMVFHLIEAAEMGDACTVHMTHRDAEQLACLHLEWHPAPFDTEADQPETATTKRLAYLRERLRDAIRLANDIGAELQIIQDREKYILELRIPRLNHEHEDSGNR